MDTVERSISSRDELVLSVLKFGLKDVPDVARVGLLQAVRSAMIAADDLAIQHPGLLSKPSAPCQT